MKAKLLIGLMLVGMLLLTGCVESNELTVHINNDSFEECSIINDTDILNCHVYGNSIEFRSDTQDES